MQNFLGCGGKHLFSTLPSTCFWPHHPQKFYTRPPSAAVPSTTTVGIEPVTLGLLLRHILSYILIPSFTELIWHCLQDWDF